MWLPTMLDKHPEHDENHSLLGLEQSFVNESQTFLLSHKQFIIMLALELEIASFLSNFPLSAIYKTTIARCI